MNYPPSSVVQVPLRVGLDEGIDPVHAPPGTLTRLDNGVWNKIGRVEKRDGTSTIAMTMSDGSPPLTTVTKILPGRSELTVTDGTSLYSRAANGWQNVGLVPELEITWDPLFGTSDPLGAYDIDCGVNYIAFAWTMSSTQVYASVRGTDGSLVVPPTLVDTTISDQVRIFVDGAGVATIFYIATGGLLNAITLGPSGLGAPTLLATTGTFDICKRGLGSGWMLLTVEAGNMKLYRLLTSLAVSGTVTTIVSFYSGGPVAVHSGLGATYVAFNGSVTSQIRVAVCDQATNALIAGPTTIRTYSSSDFVGAISVVSSNASSCVVAWEEGNGSTHHTFSVGVSNSASVIANSERQTFYAILATKLFANGRGGFYAGMYTSRAPVLVNGAAVRQATFYLANFDISDNGGRTTIPHRIAGVIAPREAALRVGAQLPRVPVVGGVAYVVAGIAGEPGTNYTGAVNALRLARVNSLPKDPCPSDTINDVRVFGGGYLASYANRTCLDVGFLQPPNVLSATPTSGGGMVTGTYLYSFVYEWLGADGLLQRSAPSQPVSVNVTSGKVDFVLECTGPSGKANLTTGFGSANPAQVHIVPYRTLVGGTTFYRMASVASLANIVINDPLAASVTFSDGKPDSNFDSFGTPLSTRPLLYTTGGILDEVIPPSFYVVKAHRGRIWGVAGDGVSIWFSKKFIEDPTVFPGFNEGLRVVLDEKIVGLESLDDKLVIFTMRGIYVLYGDGPAATGQGSDFASPTLVHGNMPCIAARSVVAFPGGIAFQTTRGIYALSRELELSWIGRQVKDDVDSAYAAGVTILSAVHVPTKSMLRFALGQRFVEDGDDSAEKGVVLVFDYSAGVWSRFLYPSWAIHEAASIYNGSGVIMALATSGAPIAVEIDTRNTEFDDSWVKLDFELTLTPSGPVAWQHLRRVQLLGSKVENHDLRVRLAFNTPPAFNTALTYAQDFTFTSDMVTTNNDCPTIRIGSQNGASPKAKSITVRVTDATPTGPDDPSFFTGKGGYFTALGLELVPKPGLPRHGAAKSKV